MSSSTNNPLPPTNNNPKETAPDLWRDDCQPPSPDTLQLWIEVGNDVDRKAIGKRIVRLCIVVQDVDPIFEHIHITSIVILSSLHT